MATEPYDAGWGAGMLLDFFAVGDMENHAGSECAKADGGYACMAHEAPPGYAWFKSGPLYANTKAYDMRPAGSPPLEPYHLQAVRISHSTRNGR